MITYEEVVERLRTVITCFEFTYNGIPCGVDPFSKTDYDVWYGDKLVKMNSIDEVINSKFFDGKTIKDIFPYIDIIAY